LICNPRRLSGRTRGGWWHESRKNEFNHWDSPFTYLIRGLRDAEVRDRVGELITEVLGEPELMGLLPGRQTALGAASLCRVAQALASEAARMLGDSEP
jgi:hypothetical protein